ncbi:MAG: serine/threonine-protein kinase [Vicinamibacteria bacterium]|nr:serine/threonine-protein kinase [Vicinamibacteria bacterium]
MPLATGARLGPYEITSPIGAGGMGEVYKARDTRLDRTVAIKILPDILAADPQFRERFDREGRAISQLTHPHICTLYDVGEHEGTAFLVMEYLEGVTLADRLVKGALPVDQALTIAIAIASALDKAHRAGIVHRDLKPGNIMLTKSGAKLLDFGLAKSQGPVIGGAGLSMLPTTPANLTAQGSVLGTFQYMAPEQLEGQEADARTDLFAFGVVLYEMLAGRRAFAGKTHASLLGAILKDQPPAVSTLQSQAPASLDHVVIKCLEKDPDERWQSAHDLHHELAWIASDATTARTAAAAPRPWRERVAWMPLLGVAVLSAALGFIGSRWSSAPVTSDAPEMRLQIVTPPDASLVGFAISPDRRALVYQATTEGRAQLWLRSLDSETARPLDGTAGASGLAPFWAPNGRSIGFFTADQLKRIDLDGGLVRTLARATEARGGTWGTTGTIVFAAASAGSLNAVPAGGGDPAVVTRVERPRQTSHRLPHFLPDGRHFLFYSLGAPDGRGVYMGALGSTDAHRLFDADSAAVFAAPDRVLFARQGALWAQRLDLSELRPVGEPVPVSTQVALIADSVGAVALSETAPGLIAYRAGAGTRQFQWFDRTGRQVGALGDPDEGQPAGPQLSPDGRTVLFRRTIGGNTDLWSIEARRNILRRLTFDPAVDHHAVWSPGGDRVVFSSYRKGVPNLYDASLSSGSASAATLLLETSENKNTTDWSADGRFILYTVQSPTTGNDIWVLPLLGDRRPTPVAQTAASERRARFSPDGRWVAFESNENGRSEIYVQSFPDAARKTQISTAGGTAPLWRGDGRELFFRSPDDQMLAARIASSGTQIDVDTPSVLFALPAGPNRDTNASWYDVSRDGQRFLVNTTVEGASPITVLLNWKPAN